MRYFSVIVLVPLFTLQAHAQSNAASSRFIFLPPGLHFALLRANPQEPRIALFQSLNNSDMKVDIGNAVDIIGFEDNGTKLTAGIDFMASAFVTGATGLRQRIDAIDGIFGGDLSYSTPLGDTTSTHQENLIEARLRLLHHSAHLVDGHYDLSTKSWIDNHEPIPYSRDFGDLVVAYVFSLSFGTLRPYAAISYATLVKPTDIQRFAYLAGVEITFDKIVRPIASQPANLYCAYNISLTGTPVYAASHQLQLGWKFGKWREKGPSIFIAYYNGRHTFGEYFDDYITRIAVGFAVDVP